MTDNFSKPTVNSMTDASRYSVFGGAKAVVKGFLLILRDLLNQLNDEDPGIRINSVYYPDQSSLTATFALNQYMAQVNQSSTAALNVVTTVKSVSDQARRLIG